MNDEIMTIEEVAEYLKLKPQTIYTWAQEKRIPAAKLGKEWRFKKSMIDEWFIQHIDEKFRGLSTPYFPPLYKGGGEEA